MVLRPQKPSLARLLQPSLGTIHRGASRAGFSVWGAGLALRWMGQQEGEMGSGTEVQPPCPWGPLPRGLRCTLARGAVVTCPTASSWSLPTPGQLSQVQSGPGSCMDHTVQLVISAKSAPVLCLGLPVHKREGEGGNPYVSRSLVLLVCLEREGHYSITRCVCVQERK